VWESWVWRIEVPVSIRRRRGGCNVRSSLLSSRGAVRLCFSAIGGASSWVLDGTPRRDNSTRDYSWPEGLPDEGSCGERLAASSRCRACVVYAERVRMQRCGPWHARSSQSHALEYIGRTPARRRAQASHPNFFFTLTEARAVPSLLFLPAVQCNLVFLLCPCVPLLDQHPFAGSAARLLVPAACAGRGTFRMRGGERACSVSKLSFTALRPPGAGGAPARLLDSARRQ
jgi:hypothetical protein